jgi:hypothetical protein
VVNSEQNLLIEGLVYRWPQWLLIVPDSFLSERAAMRAPLSDLCLSINRYLPVFPVSSVRDLLLLCVLRALCS